MYLYLAIKLCFCHVLSQYSVSFYDKMTSLKVLLVRVGNSIYVQTALLIAIKKCLVLRLRNLFFH